VEEPDRPAATPRPPADHGTGKAKCLPWNPGGGFRFSQDLGESDRDRVEVAWATGPEAMRKVLMARIWGSADF